MKTNIYSTMHTLPKRPRRIKWLYVVILGVFLLVAYSVTGAVSNALQMQAEFQEENR